MMAIRTGTNAIFSSLPGIAYHRVFGRSRDSRRRRCRWLHGWMIDRPLSGRRRVEAGSGLAHAATIHPVIHQEAFHVGARFSHANAFDEEQSVVFLAGASIDPSRKFHRTGVVGGWNLDQVAPVLVEQLRDVALAKRQVVFGVIQL